MFVQYLQRIADENVPTMLLKYMKIKYVLIEYFNCIMKPRIILSDGRKSRKATLL